MITLRELLDFLAGTGACCTIKYPPSCDDYYKADNPIVTENPEKRINAVGTDIETG
jgi:hypothetical protein